jgi:hypothetical protein
MSHDQEGFDHPTRLSKVNRKDCKVQEMGDDGNQDEPRLGQPILEWLIFRIERCIPDPNLDIESECPIRDISLQWMGEVIQQLVEALVRRIREEYDETGMGNGVTDKKIEELVARLLLMMDRLMIRGFGRYRFRIKGHSGVLRESWLAPSGIDEFMDGKFNFIEYVTSRMGEIMQGNVTWRRNELHLWILGWEIYWRLEFLVTSFMEIVNRREVPVSEGGTLGQVDSVVSTLTSSKWDDSTDAAQVHKKMD